jgi:hypothetical protein
MASKQNGVRLFSTRLWHKSRKKIVSKSGISMFVFRHLATLAPSPVALMEVNLSNFSNPSSSVWCCLLASQPRPVCQPASSEQRAGIMFWKNK